MKYNASVQRNQHIWSGKQWINLNVSDSRIFNYQLAETDQQLFNPFEICCGPSANTFQCLNDPCVLHHASRQRCCKRGQRVSTVLKHLDKLTTQTKDQHRTELRICRTAKNQLVAEKGHHRLNCDAVESSA